jgi:hypothetical protein
MSAIHCLLLVCISTAGAATSFERINHFESNFTALPNIRFERSVSDDMGVFGSLGVPLGIMTVINAGIDYYPFAPSRGFFTQLECPLYIMETMVNDAPDTLTCYPFPSIMVGTKVYVWEDKLYLRFGLGMGLGFQTERGSVALPTISFNSFEDVLASGFRLQLNLGCSHIPEPIGKNSHP